MSYPLHLPTLRRSPSILLVCLLSLLLGVATSVPAAGIVLGKAGDAVLFSASDNDKDPGESGDQCLWRTDGTAEGTYRLPGCRTPETGSIRPVGDRAVFWEYGRDNTTRLWGTDGTAGGTQVLGTFPDRAPRGELTPVTTASGGERLVYTASDPVHGHEPRMTDGTAQGTRLLADVVPGAGGSDADGFTPVGDGELFFFARSQDGGRAGWRLDLERGDLRRVFDIPEVSPPWRVSPAAAADDRVIFWRQRQSPHCGGDSPCPSELWSVGADPTSALRLAVYPDVEVPSSHSLKAAGGYVYFRRDVGGGQTWRSDGLTVEQVTSPEGLSLRVDTTHFEAPDPPVFPRQVGEATLMRLARADGATGFELWRVDGSGPQASLLGDICPGPCSGVPETLYLPAILSGPHSPILPFYANDELHGSELWLSDGTRQGTRLPRDFCPGDCDGRGRIVDAEGPRLLLRARSPEGVSLFALDPGTGATDMLWSPGDDPTLIVGTSQRVGESVFFAVHSPFGADLWLTDGTVRGTRLFLDLSHEPGPVTEPPAIPRDLHVRDNRLVGWWPGDDGGLPESYILEARSPSLGGWVTWAEVLALGHRSASTIVDLPQGEPVSLRVRAVNRAGVSPPTTEVDTRFPGNGFFPDQPCDPAVSLCLGGGRYGVRVDYLNQHETPPESGIASPRDLDFTDRTGVFSFFAPDNVELVVKALDGTGVNGHHWLFYGALTDVEYWVTLTDHTRGEHVTYRNPPGDICGRGDVTALDKAFPTTIATAPALSALELPPPGPHTSHPGASHPTTPCVEDATTLCLLDGRYAVTVEWEDHHNDRSGVGGAVPFADRSGFFWFFKPDNVELVVKVLDGTPVNGNTWVFYGALTDVGYTLTVTDTATDHAVETYVNEPGNVCGGADTDAF